MNLDYYRYINRTEYQRLKQLLDNWPNQLPKFTPKNLVYITDDNYEIYTANQEDKYETAVLIMSSLYDCNEVFILVKGTISILNSVAIDVNANHTDTKIIFKNCALFKNWKTHISSAKFDHSKNIGILIPKQYEI